MDVRSLITIGLVALVLAGCAEEPAGFRYRAEQQLWKARQLERRVNSQPEAAGATIDEAIAEYGEVLDRFPLDPVREDSLELALVGQIRAAAGLGLVRLHLGMKDDPAAAIAVLEGIRGETPWDMSVLARIYAELLRLEKDFGAPETIVTLLDEVVERIPPADASGEPLPLVLEAPTQKAEILAAIDRRADAQAELAVAHVYYDDLIESHPGTRLEVAALLQKANTLVLEGRVAEADATLSRARSARAAEPMIPSILQTQANLRQQIAGDPRGAIALLYELHREHPEDPRAPGALLQAGIAYRAAGLPDSALAVFSRVQSLYPRDLALASQARFLAAKVLETTGATDAAVREYRSVAAEYPRTASGLLAPLELATLYQSTGNEDAARAELLRAAEEYQRVIRDLSADPRQAETVLTTMDYLAEVWTRLERWKEAVDTLLGLAEQFPGDRRSPLAYVRAATIQEEQLRDRQGAIGTLERLTTRYPDLPLSRRAAERIEQLRDAS